MDKRKRSYIWTNFDVGTDGKAKCRHCHQKICFSGGPSNLRRHIKLKHVGISLKRLDLPVATRSSNIGTNDEEEAEILDDPMEGVINEGGESIPSTSAQPMAQPVQEKELEATSLPLDLIRTSRGIGSYFQKPMSAREVEKVDKQLGRFVARHMHPYSIIEEDEFRKLMKLLIPNYRVPSRKTLSTNIIPQLYNSTVAAVKERILEASFVALTTDGWTSSKSEKFTAVTCHYIDQNQELKTNLLECVEVNEKQTAVNVGDNLKNVARKWGIENKVTCIVTDNAANMKAGIRTTQYRNLTCAAHSLNLVVKKGLEEVEGLLSIIRSTVDHFKRSSTAAARFASTQAQEGYTVLKLKRDVCTRWNSTLDMIARFLERKESILSTMGHFSSLPAIQEEDWTMLSELATILKPFKDVTVELSSEKTVTLSKVIVLIGILSKDISEKIQKCRSENCKKVLQILHKELKEKFPDVEKNELLAESTFLDPRFKRQGFASKEALFLCHNRISQRASQVVSPSAASSAAREIVEEEEEEETIWASFDRQISQNRVTTTSTSLANGIIEVDRYLDEPHLRRKGCPLIWWQDRQKTYPRIYTLALRRLLIPATSVPSERIFSKGGLILNDRRTRLSSKNVSQLVFLSANLE